MDKIFSFYTKTVSDLIVEKNAKILVCGAQVIDKEVFKNLGYQNVLLSGLDERKCDYTPFEWTKENAESLSFEDNSFDYVVIHSAIHHTSCPHKVITEMYRVARKGVLAFEGRDSFLMQHAERFGFTQRYEVAGAYPTSGVDASDIPNFIYRWTEREIEKTINTYAPCYKHKFTYKYWLLYPEGPDLSKSKKIILKTLRPFFELFFYVFPKQKNGFAFYIEKPKTEKSLLPWLSFDENKKKIIVNYNWIATQYTKRKNRQV